jgi:hypothetical protein
MIRSIVVRASPVSSQISRFDNPASYPAITSRSRRLLFRPQLASSCRARSGLT